MMPSDSKFITATLVGALIALIGFFFVAALAEGQTLTEAGGTHLSLPIPDPPVSAEGDDEVFEITLGEARLALYNFELRIFYEQEYIPAYEALVTEVDERMDWETLCELQNDPRYVACHQEPAPHGGQADLDSKATVQDSTHHRFVGDRGDQHSLARDGLVALDVYLNGALVVLVDVGHGHALADEILGLPTLILVHLYARCLEQVMELGRGLVDPNRGHEGLSEDIGAVRVDLGCAVQDLSHQTMQLQVKGSLGLL